MRHSSFSLLPILLLLCLLSSGLFGYGAFLHFMSRRPVAVVLASAKPAPTKRHAKSGAGKTPAHSATLAVPPLETGEAAYRFLVAGGVGMLLSALGGLVLAGQKPVAAPTRALAAVQSQSSVWEKQRRELDAQREQLQAQLQEAQHSKAEMDRQRQYASRQFQEFFRTLPIACFCFAPDGKIVRWNAACETLYGLAASEATESTLWETLVPLAGREVMEAWMSRVLAGESLLDVVREDQTLSGEVLQVCSSMVPLLDAAGAIIGGMSASIHLAPSQSPEGQNTGRESELHDALQKTLTALEAQQAEVGRLTNDLAAAQSAAAAARGQTQTEEVERDVITGLLGSEAFQEKLRIETERAARYHTALSVVMLDLDAFTQYNQAQDTDAGDNALRAVAGMIETKLRTVDVAARCGADEYGLILPETGQTGASVAAERLRSGIAGIAWPKQPLTACFGVAVLTPDVSSPEELAARAADALRCAKSLGANSIVNHSEMPQPEVKKPKPRAPRVKKVEVSIGS